MVGGWCSNIFFVRCKFSMGMNEHRKPNREIIRIIIVQNQNPHQTTPPVTLPSIQNGSAFCFPCMSLRRSAAHNMGLSSVAVSTYLIHLYCSQHLVHPPPSLERRSCCHSMDGSHEIGLLRMDGDGGAAAAATLDEGCMGWAHNVICRV